jgi:hypothetical protein
MMLGEIYSNDDFGDRSAESVDPCQSDIHKYLYSSTPEK